MPPRCRFAPTPRPGISICREPFRLLFPIALLASIAGVALWPLNHGGLLGFYPAEAHARLMIQGFVGGFALGFLSTAFPKMIGSPPLSPVELVLLTSTLIGCVLAHSFNLLAAGDWCFLLLWLVALHCFGARLAFFRQSLPPPGFILAAMGIAAALVATTLLLVGRIILLSEFQRTLASLLLNEAFILGPVLGIGSFLFPRFFSAPTVPAHTKTARSWNNKATGYFWLGILLLATYVSQAAGSTLVAPLARAGIVATVLLTRLPLLRRDSGTGTLSTLLRISLILIILGVAMSIVDPATRIAAKHTLYIGGFGMLALTVASRVTLGHSGNIALAEGTNRALQIVLGILLLAAATRIVAGFVPKIRISHHIYASGLWVIAAATWGWAVLRYVRIADPDDKP